MNKNNLPKELKLDCCDYLTESQQEAIVQRLNDDLAKVYGFANKGFDYTIVIKIKNIDWETK